MSRYIKIDKEVDDQYRRKDTKLRDPLSQVQIKYKLTGAFVGICLLAFGVGGYLISVSAGTALENEINRRLAAEGAGLARELSDRLGLIGNRAEDFASDGYIRELMEMSYVDINDKDLVSTQKGADTSLVAHLARNKFPLIPALDDLLLTNNLGALLASVQQPQRSEAHISISELLQHDTLCCSSFTRENGDTTVCFTISTPVWDIHKHRRIGMLLFHIDLRRLLLDLPGYRRLFSDQMPADQTVILLDQSGHRYRVAERTSDVMYKAAGTGHSDRVVVSPLYAGIDKKHVPEENLSSGIVQEHPVGDNGWRVRVYMDAQQAMLPVSGLQSSFLGAGVLIGLVSLLLLYFPVRYFVRPLVALRDAARTMTAGDFSVRVDESGEDEIGDVARSFNLMAAATEERTTRLQNTALQLEQQSKALSIERDLLNTVVFSMDDAVLYFDRNGKLLLHNSTAEPLLSSLQGDSQDLHPRRCGCEEPGILDCKQCLLDYRIPPRDCLLEVGDRVYEIVSSSIASSAGREGTVLVGRDITERLRIDEIQAHQDRLAVLGEVSAVMAHELNNPLAAISMFAQMMRSDMKGDNPHIENLDVILRNTDSCKRTIRDLLSYGHGEVSGVEECDIHDILFDVVRFLRPLYEKSNVCFDLKFMKEEALLTTDETYLRQVFVNLIMNALQATDMTGGIITVHTRKAEDVSDSLIVEIIDNGPGIPEAYHTDIFEPFFTSKPAGKGTGLGLSISRRIVTTLGGTLELTASRRGETIFTVSMPRNYNSATVFRQGASR